MGKRAGAIALPTLKSEGGCKAILTLPPFLGIKFKKNTFLL
jgi:hypothetical protein